MFDIREFAYQLQELIEENYYLRQENERLTKVEKEYYDYINKTYDATTKVTGEWLKLLIDKNIQITDQ